MFTALLDSCVLWPSLQRDVLLSMAVECLYRPVWSAHILDEVEYNEVEKAIDRWGEEDDEAARRGAFLIAQMRKAFSDAEVTNYEALIGTFGLPDPDDEHVVAAAVIAGAGVIVTDNLRDFPSHRLPPPVRAVSPADFARDTVSVDPLVALAAVQELSRRRSTPPADILDLLLMRYGWNDAVDLLRAVLPSASSSVSTRRTK